MRNNKLDDIIKCDISISNPVSTDLSVDRILLIVTEPKTPGEKSTEKAFLIKKVDDLVDYGYTEKDDAYIAASIAFAQRPSPRNIAVICRKKIASASGLSGTGANLETITTTLDRAVKEVSFYGIHISDFRTTADVEAVAGWTEKNEKLFVYEFKNIAENPLKKSSYFRTISIFTGNADGYSDAEQPKDNGYAGIALMAKCFGYEPGTETWNLKELNKISPSSLSDKEKEMLSEKHINTFLRYASTNCLIGGYTVAGEWIDVIRFRDWLKNSIQANVFNTLRVNTKVPMTDSGIGLIQGAIEEVLKTGQNIGGIAETVFDENDKPIHGYTITVPKSSNLSESERKSRNLAGCYYKARLSGAIHTVEVVGHLTF